MQPHTLLKLGLLAQALLLLSLAGAAGLQAASAAEEEANKKRWEEAGEKGSIDQW